MVYILLADGFEEIEAIAPLDLLRRADIKAYTASITDDLLVRGGHGVVVQADTTIEQIDFAQMDMLVLPGGGGGVATIANNPAAMDLIMRAWKAEKMLAAICAAPSLLAKLNILDGRMITCHPTVVDEVRAAGGRPHPELSVACDHNLITGRAAGSSIDFGLELVTAICVIEASEQLRKALYI